MSAKFCNRSKVCNRIATEWRPDMSFRDNIRKVVPYTPGDQPKLTKMVKLNTNENPYPPSKEVEKALQGLDMDRFKLYPDPKIEKLVGAIADNMNVSADNVFVGVGSDDVLAMAFMTFFNSDKPIIFPEVTYSFYDVWADLFKIPYKTFPLNEDFTIDVKDLCVENGGVVLANPNAPTGIYEELDFVEEVLKNNQDSVVIVDEAYIDFGGKSAVSLLDKYENLVVVQTFSKSRSMAGMRIGFAVASAELIAAMNAVKHSYNSYTMSYAAIEAGVAAVNDKAYFDETRGKVMATRENAKKELTARGFTFPDSMTNFIFATHKDKKAGYIFEELRSRGIFVRYFNKPGIDNYLRITIGTDEQMQELYDALDEILA